MKRYAKTTTALLAGAAVTALVAGAAVAHGGGQPGYGGMMMGPGMMGHGFATQGQGFGPGMMGHGFGGQPQGFGPGMMGQGQGFGPGAMNPGMMGGAQGFGPGAGAGPCAFQQGAARDLDLDADAVKARLERWLTVQGNDRLTLGKVEVVDDDTITAEIVTVDNSLVQTLTVDRHTGWTRPAR